MRVLNYGADKDFPDRVPLDTLYERYRLTTDLMMEDAANALGLLEYSK